MKIEEARKEWTEARKAYLSEVGRSDEKTLASLSRREESSLLQYEQCLDDEETMVVDTEEVLARAGTTEPATILNPVSRFTLPIKTPPLLLQIPPPTKIESPEMPKVQDEVVDEVQDFSPSLGFEMTMVVILFTTFFWLLVRT